jgi:hypothetical protein
MATTTNYGWTTPDDTALVKDGAAAIRTLGSSIDTSLNTALGTKKAGLVLLNTTSFSAVASQSINDVFSATYDNYRIVINQNASVDTSFYFRLRVAGADNTASNYAWVKFLYRSGIQIDSGNGSDTFWNLATNSVVRRGLITIDIGQPFATQNTVFNTQFSWSDASFQVSGIAGGNTSVTTSYTGFTIFPASGTITGEVSVYGYNK